MDSLRKSIGVKSNYQSIYENKNLKDIKTFLANLLFETRM